jgi:hypothetical protein
MPRVARCVVTRQEIAAAFAKGGSEDRHIVSPEQLAAIIVCSRKTIYDWIAKGRLDGTFRKRGKHILIWRDKALDLLLNGPDWTNNEQRRPRNRREPRADSPTWN